DALVADPPLLVLDEPTAGLDPNQIRDVRELIRSFARDKTVFLSTHILPEVEATCDRVVIITDGRKVGEGPPGSLRAASKGRARLLLEGRGELEAFEKALGGVPEVLEIERLEAIGANSKIRAELITDGADRAPEAVFHAVAEAGLVLRSMEPRSERLEDVFAALTTEDPDGSAGRDEASDAEAPAGRDDAIDSDESKEEAS
ncbi:MAG: AAA family ATPase, partial [Myxococcales bacterium]|nr:AAA family ATPase [Myxococcales bacterium]